MAEITIELTIEQPNKDCLIKIIALGAKFMKIGDKLNCSNEIEVLSNLYMIFITKHY